MFTLARAKRAMGEQGEPIPTVFKSLAGYDFHFRRGQLTLVAAAPGVGKSILAQTLAMKCGAPALYFSADSDAFTMYKRGAAIVTGHRSKDIERDYEKGNGVFYDEKLNQLQNLRFDFTASPSATDLEESVNAFALAYGEYPHLLVVDNLMNVDPADIVAEGQRSSVGAVMAYLKTLAKATNASVVMLHHLTGGYDDGTDPPPLSALIDKVSKLPEAALTLFRPEMRLSAGLNLGVCIVKNRDGESDPSGGLVVYMDYAPSYARLEDKAR